jgi:hypothetical protein
MFKNSNDVELLRMMLTESVAFLCVCGNSDKGKLKGKKGVVSETKNLPGLEYNFFLQMNDVWCFGICIILQPTCCCKHLVDVLKSPKVQMYKHFSTSK